MVEKILNNKRACFANDFTLLGRQRTAEESSTNKYLKQDQRGKKVRQSSSSIGKENIPKGKPKPYEKPLKNENLEEMRKRMSQQQHNDSPNHRVLNQLGLTNNLSSIKSNQYKYIEENKSCSVFDISKSGNTSLADASLSGVLTPSTSPPNAKAHFQGKN
jgi:hypothetical protein